MMLRMGWIGVFLLALLAGPSWSMEVTKVAGKKVMLDLKGESVKPGDVLSVGDGKKIQGLLKVQKVSGQKAIAAIGKGTAKVGWIAQHRAAKGGGGKGSAPTRARREDSGSSGGGAGQSKSYWGALVGMSMNSVTAKVGNPAVSKSLSGSSFSAKGLFDYELFPSIWFRGLGGMQGLKASGDTGCNGGTCTIDIMYLSFDFWGRYAFNFGSIKPWAGAGFSLLFPMTKKATAVEENSITNTSLLSVGVGADWFLGGGWFVPLQVEYGLYPKSETVEANAISFSIGLGVPF